MELPVWKLCCPTCEYDLPYSGIEHGIHLHTKATAFTYELLLEADRMITSKGGPNFKMFCDNKSAAYQDFRPACQHAVFVKSDVFLKALLGWYCTLGDIVDEDWKFLNFRGSCFDGKGGMVCARNAYICDGTTGISFTPRFLEAAILQAARAETCEKRPPRSTDRFQRCVCPAPQPQPGEKWSKDQAAERQKKYLMALEQLQAELNELLKLTTMPAAAARAELRARVYAASTLVDKRLLDAIVFFMSDDTPAGPVHYEGSHALQGNWLQLLRECVSTTAPVIQLLSGNVVELLLPYLDGVVSQTDLRVLALEQCLAVNSPIFYRALQPFLASTASSLPPTLRAMLLFAVERQKEVYDKLSQNKLGECSPLSGTNDPLKYGAWFNFEPEMNGCMVRPWLWVPGLDADPKSGKRGPEKDHDDKPPEGERCSKTFASRKDSYVIFFMCPVHEICLGYSIIDGHEGRKDVLQALLRYKIDLPTVVMYDFACGASEYCLNRAGDYFKDTKFFHDHFHSHNHKCGDAFKFRSRKDPTLPHINTSVCEEFNAGVGGIGNCTAREHAAASVHLALKSQEAPDVRRCPIAGAMCACCGRSGRSRGSLCWGHDRCWRSWPRRPLRGRQHRRRE